MTPMLTDNVEKTCTRRYIRIPAVSEMMGGASRKYVEGLIIAGKLRAFKPSRKMTLVLLDDVIAYIESHEIQPAAKTA